MIKAILFDIDGTLLDTTEFIFQAVEHNFKSLGLNPPSREVMAKLVGMSLKDAYQNLIPNSNIKMLHKIHADFQVKNAHLAIAFPGIKQVLKTLKLKNYKLAAITSRHEDTLFQSLDHNGIRNIFDVIISADNVKNHKPHPEPVLKAVKLLNIKPYEAVMVGDSVFDIEAAKSAGVKVVAVTYGFGKKENLISQKADYYIDDLKELLNLDIL